MWGFDLSADAAFDVLQDWNARCDPPWSEQELRHKIDDARRANHEKPRGHLRDAPLNGFHAPSGNTAKQTGEGDADEICLTDTGNGKRYVAEHGAIIRYCHPWKKWIIWDGMRWRIDDTGYAMLLAKGTILGLFSWAQKQISFLAKSQGQGAAAKLGKIKAVLGWAHTSQGAQPAQGNARSCAERTGNSDTPGTARPASDDAELSQRDN